MRNKEARLLRAVACLLNRVAAGGVNADAAAECIENAFNGKPAASTLQHEALVEPISYLGSFSVRTRKILKRMEIETVGELVALSADEIINQRNCGETSLLEIRGLLGEKGLKLRGD